MIRFRSPSFRFACLSGVFLVVATVAAAAPAWPIKVGPTNRYLVDQAGTPFLLHADSPWSLIVGVTKEDAELYLEDRRQKGFNAIMVNLIEHYFTDNPPYNVYGVAPFTTPGNFATPNEEYFAHADWVIDRAAEKGITVLLFPCYLGYEGTPEGWYEEAIANGDAKNAAFGRWVGARYRNRPNLIWMMSGDRDPDDARTMVEAMVAGMKEEDPNHIFTAHCERKHSGRSQYPNSPWLDFDTAYTDPTVGVYAACLDAYAEQPAKPVVFIEGFYENTRGMTAADLRHQSYEAMLSGACGTAFGNRPLWPFERGWQDELDSPGSLSMPLVLALFRSRNWSSLVPDAAHDIVTAGYGSNFEYVSCARTSDGATVIIYLHDSAPSIPVDLTHVAGTAARAWWYNPRDGTATTPGTYPTTGSHTFTRPDGNDWILVLDNAALDLPAPGTEPPGFAIVTPTLPAGTAHVAYATQLEATGGVTPYAWSLASGSGALPAGLVLSAEGQLSGTTAVAGDFAIVVQVRDATNATATQAFTLTLADDPSIVGITLGSLSTTYDGTPRAVTFTTSPAGLTPTITYNGGTSPPVNPGSYTVTATYADTTRSGSATGTLIVAKAPLIARAVDKQKLPGSANPPLTIVYLGLIPGEAVTELDALPAIATTAVTNSPAGTYPITLSGGTDNHYAFTLQPGVLTVTGASAAPAINEGPRSQNAVAGATVTLLAVASGTQPLTYTWFKNGAELPGPGSSALTLSSTDAADAGSYSVAVSNAFGRAVSELATVTILPPSPAPFIVAQPQAQVVREGARARFSVRATGAGPLTYQWFRDGSPRAGATEAILTIDPADPADAGTYRVRVANNLGEATSREVTLAVSGASYAGEYFGTFAGDRGRFALHVRDDQSAVFFGYDRTGPVLYEQRALVIDGDGNAQFPVRVSPAATLATGPTLSLSLAADGSLVGTSAGAGLQLTGARSPATGLTAAIRGYYEAGTPLSPAFNAIFVGGDGTTFVVAQDGGAEVDAAFGQTGANGVFNGTTERSVGVTAMFDGAASLVSTAFSVPAAPTVSFSGARADTRPEAEMLLNISTRGPTAAGSGTMIGGFVITGTEPKTLLLRGIGPSLADFGVSGILPAARLQLYRGATLLAEAGDWGAAADVDAITATAAQVGAFPVSRLRRDAAMLATLAPGAYTVFVVGANGATGVGLVEAYDATAGAIAPDERVINISTRGFVGQGDRVQIAGFVIRGVVPKRVLIRGIGPGLAPHVAPGEVADLLADPLLELYDVSGGLLATNDDWHAGNAMAEVAALAAAVSAFPLAAGSRDAALLRFLDPGTYTAHLRGVAGGEGIGLIEVYDAD